MYSVIKSQHSPKAQATYYLVSMAKTISITDQGVQLTNSEDSELNLFGITLSSDYMTVPSGNTLQRPNPAEVGMVRLNTDTAKLEGYDGTYWANIEP